MLRNTQTNPNLDIIFNTNRINALLSTINQAIAKLENSHISQSLEATLAALKDSIRQFEIKKLNDYVLNKDRRIENLFGIIDIFNSVYKDQELFSNLDAAELHNALNEYADEMEVLRETIDHDIAQANMQDLTPEASTSSDSEVDYSDWRSWSIPAVSLFDFETRTPTPADLEAYLMDGLDDVYAPLLPEHLLSDDEDMQADFEDLNWHFNDLFPGQEARLDELSDSNTVIISSLDNSNYENVVSEDSRMASDEEDYAEEEESDFNFKRSSRSAFSLFQSSSTSSSKSTSDSEEKYSPLPARFGQ